MKIYRSKEELPDYKKQYKLCLYGKLRQKVVAYCILHKCYLEPLDIKEKRCNTKKCKYLINVK